MFTPLCWLGDRGSDLVLSLDRLTSLSPLRELLMATSLSLLWELLMATSLSLLRELLMATSLSVLRELLTATDFVERDLLGKGIKVASPSWSREGG